MNADFKKGLYVAAGALVAIIALSWLMKML
jgi:hypothetical protein